MPRPPTYRERLANTLASQGTMSSYEPSFRERIGEAVRSYWPFSDREQKAQDITGLLDWAPGTSEAFAADETKRALDAGNYGAAAATAALGVLPGPVAKVIKKGGKAVGKKVAAKVADVLEGKPLGYDPMAMSERYPELGPEVMKQDPITGKLYPSREQSEEAKAVGKVREAARQEIKSGEWTPYYDVSQREYVDPAGYGRSERTLDVQAAKPETRERHRSIYDTPEGKQRLREAYARGKAHPGAHDWYAMKQYEDDYIRDFGPDEGRRRFQTDFADAMAATTGGSSPEANFIMSQYANWKRRRGEPLPVTRDLPSPVGGRFAKGNLDQYEKMINQGQGVTLDNPKRYAFSGNFTGRRDLATMDEQMTGGLVPGLGQPKGESY